MSLKDKTIDIQNLVNAKPDGIYGNETADKVLRALRVETDVVTEVSRNEKVISKLHSTVRPFMRELIRVSAEQGMLIHALSGFRSYAEQDALYDKHNGVTNAKGGYSGHNFGIACDFGIFENGKYIDEEVDKGRYSRARMDELYKKLGQLGKSIGLSWGGDWKNPVDMPHFYYRPAWSRGLTESELMAGLRARHDNGTDVFVA